MQIHACHGEAFQLWPLIEDPDTFAMSVLTSRRVFVLLLLVFGTVTAPEPPKATTKESSSTVTATQSSTIVTAAPTTITTPEATTTTNNPSTSTITNPETTTTTTTTDTPGPTTTAIPVTYKEDPEAKQEAQCRNELHDLGIELYLLISAVGVLSVIFLAVSIYVFVFIQKYMLREMDEAINKAHDVMDAVLVSLLPNHLMDEIGGGDGKTIKKSEKTD